ncbi:heterokaryon incompatibility protein-domain-containing protein [Annulohypoxylon maeteangense]|uniref:heterokaryon incompatibility protein-domain-containing protein n=1 Tax=Annulohypoxylon maeteangense TaxID=1927788 RepID=UPI0020078685|nr:heterokaryon incompatibility protein-domain-containing protein [Annulohypoxylon maeteangense]KAI0890583.1 heterokaryon incompatibility protein-domain-containing protein [Annulohypoxylon maeteangense]
MSSTSSALYHSLPLSIPKKSIRVLDFHGNVPDSPTEVLQGHMRVIDLLDKPTFTALSYVWGPYHSPPHEICCDGSNIRITSNCRAALCALRRRFGPISIWVDSICMNQQDDGEKETQIPLMGDIYSLAVSVYIWLGDETLESEAAIGYLGSAGFQSHFTSVAVTYYLSQRSRWVHWRIAWSLFTRRHREFVANWWKYGFLSGAGTLLVGFRAPPDKLIHYKGLEDFFSREWASRVWTLQEAILAKNPIVCCGETVLAWRPIIYSIAYLEYAGQNYGVGLPEANFNVWRNIVLLWLFVNPDSRHRDRLLDNSLSSEITLQRFMPEYWGFLEAIAQKHRRLAWVALCIHIPTWLVIIALLRNALGIETFMSEVAGVLAVVVAMVSVAISLADPVFRWPVCFPRETVKHITNIPNAIIHELCARNATNPRDKFYGMYAIFSRLGIGLSPPEYSRTPEDVHREAFLILLNWTNSLGLLLCSSRQKSNYESSWVPDWREDLAQGWFEASYLFRKGRYDATPNSPPLWSLRNSKQLALRGVIISSIIEHTDPFQIIDDDAIRLRYDQPLFLNELRTLAEYCQSGNPVLTRFFQPNPGPPNAPDSTLMLNMTALNLSYWLEILNPLAQNERLLFKTSIPDRNTVGSCPIQSQVGDLIALASGVPLPLVLRPEESSYRLIGFAEVDGLMEGECWANLTNENLIDIVLT